MILLGIDPGTAETGYGVITVRGSRLEAVDHGVIATSAREPLEQRLVQIFAEVKRTVCGFGRADKGQVGRMVVASLRMPRPPASEHSADALAVAICHAHSSRAQAVRAAAG